MQPSKYTSEIANSYYKLCVLPLCQEWLTVASRKLQIYSFEKTLKTGHSLKLEFLKSLKLVCAALLNY